MAITKTVRFFEVSLTSQRLLEQYLSHHICEAQFVSDVCASSGYFTLSSYTEIWYNLLWRTGMWWPAPSDIGDVYRGVCGPLLERPHKLKIPGALIQEGQSIMPYMSFGDKPIFMKERTSRADVNYDPLREGVEWTVGTNYIRSCCQSSWFKAYGPVGRKTFWVDTDPVSPTHHPLVSFRSYLFWLPQGDH